MALHPSAMDPDKFTTVPAIPSAVSSPVATTSMASPEIFQFSPLPGLPSEGGVVDIFCGKFAAFVAYAAHYDLSLVIQACPDLAAFQVAHPLANIWPFSEVSPRIIFRGHKLFALAPLGAQGVPAVLLGARSTSGSSHGLLSLLLHVSHSAASRGADPPSFLGGPRRSFPLSAVPEGLSSMVGAFSPHPIASPQP
jgi:hypothetical protein